MEYPFFGVFPRREYRYDQIYRVREKRFSVLRIPLRYVIIDYVGVAGGLLLVSIFMFSL